MVIDMLRRGIAYGRNVIRRYGDLVLCVVFILLALVLQKIYGIQYKGDYNAFTAIVPVVLELFLVIKVNKEIEELQTDRFMPYTYLSKRFDPKLDVSYILPSIIMYAICAFMHQLVSIFILMVYWGVVYFIKKYKISKLRDDLYVEQEVVDIFAQSSRISQEEVARLFENGIIRANDTKALNLFVEFFDIYLTGRREEKAEYSAFQKKYSLVYSQISSYGRSFEEGRGLIDFLVKWIERIPIYDKQENYNQLIQVAAIVSYVNFEKSREEQREFYSKLRRKLGHNDEEKMCILLLSAEFCYLYNKYGANVKLEVPDEIICFLYRHVCLKNWKDADFMRMMWCIWTDIENVSLSASIIVFEVLLRYLYNDEIALQSTSYTLKGKSLYLLIQTMNS